MPVSELTCVVAYLTILANFDMLSCLGTFHDCCLEVLQRNLSRTSDITGQRRREFFG